jgi:hypothetical protein
MCSDRYLTTLIDVDTSTICKIRHDDTPIHFPITSSSHSVPIPTHHHYYYHHRSAAVIAGPPPGYTCVLAAG